MPEVDGMAVTEVVAVGTDGPHPVAAPGVDLAGPRALALGLSRAGARASVRDDATPAPAEAPPLFEPLTSWC
jgi:hypothetical protein